MLRSPSHTFLDRTIQAAFFIFFSFFLFLDIPLFPRILLCVQSSTSFHRYFSVRSREEQSKIFACKSVSKLTVAFGSCINPLHLRETGPKSCTFTYLLSRRGNRVSRADRWADRRADRRATFRPRLFLLPKNQSRENRLARSHGL